MPPVIAVGAEDPVALMFEIVLPETTRITAVSMMNIIQRLRSRRSSYENIIAGYFDRAF